MFKISTGYLIKSAIVLCKYSGYTYAHEAHICKDMYIVSITSYMITLITS